jgi:hypothetical protein
MELLLCFTATLTKCFTIASLSLYQAPCDDEQRSVFHISPAENKKLFGDIVRLELKELYPLELILHALRWNLLTTL